RGRARRRARPCAARSGAATPPDPAARPREGGPSSAGSCARMATWKRWRSGAGSTPQSSSSVGRNDAVAVADEGGDERAPPPAAEGNAVAAGGHFDGSKHEGAQRWVVRSGTESNGFHYVRLYVENSRGGGSWTGWMT